MHGHANSNDVDHTKFWYRTCRCLQAGDWAMFISKWQLSMTTPRGRLCRLRYTGDRVTGGQFMTVCSAKDELSRFLGDTTWQRTGLEAYHPSKTTIDMTLPWCGGLEDYFSSTNMTVIINDYQWLSMIIRVTLFVGDCWGDAKYGEPPPNWDDRSWPWVPLAGGVQTLNKRSDMVCHRR